MTFEEFRGRFQPAETTKEARAAEAQPEPAPVLIAGTVITATEGACTLDINGSVYEVGAGDIAEVQLLSALVPRPEGEKEEAAEETGIGPSDVVLLKLNPAANLICRIPVQAEVVAAAGTWIALTPTETSEQRQTA